MHLVVNVAVGSRVWSRKGLPWALGCCMTLTCSRHGSCGVGLAKGKIVLEERVDVA